MKEIENDKSFEVGRSIGIVEGFERASEQYNGISPSTVTEMIEALREYHDQLSKWAYPSEQEINRMNFKAEEVLSKADKELKK